MNRFLKILDNFFSKDIRKQIELHNRVQTAIVVGLGVWSDSIGIDYFSLQSYGITDLQIKEVKNTIQVIITTTRPGLVIGKGGRTIDYVKNVISRLENDKPVTIEIKESTLWRKLEYKGWE